MYRIRFSLTFIIVVIAFAASGQRDITGKELKKHLSFLAGADMKGRFPGTPENEKVVGYLIKSFKKSGIKTYDTSYIQNFNARIRVKKGVTDTPIVGTQNVIGFIEGVDPVLKNEFIVLGAHYDHLGMGGPSSKKKDTVGIHLGADDNASGTSALMEIGQKLAANRKQLKRSILLIAFGAEEQGLLGSAYFVEHPVIPLSAIKLMLNMDMLGRMNTEKQIYMGGAASFNGGMELMKSLGPVSGINPIVIPYDIGGSDHVSFYRKNIPVLGFHTGGHPQYHTPEDTVDLINVGGLQLACDYIYSAILNVAGRSDAIYFVTEKKN